MRHIAALDDGKIPGDDEFNFRTRAKNLVDKWHQILNANKPTTGSPTVSPGQANGKSDKEITKEEDVITNGTKNIELNGTNVDHGEGNEEDANAEIADVSMLADVTMSEA